MSHLGFKPLLVCDGALVGLRTVSLTTEHTLHTETMAMTQSFCSGSEVESYPRARTSISEQAIQLEWKRPV